MQLLVFHALRQHVINVATAAYKPRGAARVAANLKVGVIRWARSRAHVNIEIGGLRELATQSRRHLLLQASIELPYLVLACLGATTLKGTVPNLFPNSSQLVPKAFPKPFPN